MAEEETGVDDVKTTDIVGWIGNIRPAIPDRLYVVGGGFIATDRQLGLIHIKTKDLTRNADPASKLRVTSPPPHPTSRHDIPGRTPIPSKKSWVPRCRMLLNTRSRSRPARPPLIE